MTRILVAAIAASALFCSNVAEPDRAVVAIAGAGVNVDQPMTDMKSPDVAEHLQQDRNDAMTMQVTAMPE